MKTHLKFEVEVNPLLVEKIGDLMSRCDLGVTKVLRPESFICEWDTTTKVSKEYISKMKKKLKEAFELDGSKVLSLKKIK